MLDSMDGLAGIYKSQGLGYKEAEALFQQVLAGREKPLGINHHHDTLTSVNNPLVYESQGRH
jgi:hypothetical protein